MAQWKQQTGKFVAKMKWNKSTKQEWKAKSTHARTNTHTKANILMHCGDEHRTQITVAHYYFWQQSKRANEAFEWENWWRCDSIAILKLFASPWRHSFYSQLAHHSFSIWSRIFYNYTVFTRNGHKCVAMNRISSFRIIGMVAFFFGFVNDF